MKLIILSAAILFAQVCSAEEIDFILMFTKSPETRKALGIEKLTKDEQATLNNLLNRAYQLGAEHQAQPNNQGKGPAKPIQPGAQKAARQPVYITKIDEDNNDVLKLTNGAIVEITQGFLGFVGFRKDAVLYKAEGRWKIWIQGKKSFNCAILKAPLNEAARAGELVWVSEALGGGQILKTLNGSIFEVGILSRIDTALWFGAFDALLIDGSRLLKLDDGSGIIDVIKIR